MTSAWSAKARSDAAHHAPATGAVAFFAAPRIGSRPQALFYRKAFSHIRSACIRAAYLLDGKRQVERIAAPGLLDFRGILDTDKERVTLASEECRCAARRAQADAMSDR